MLKGLQKGKMDQKMNGQMSFFTCLLPVSLSKYSYGKHVPGATFHYEICCYFPQNARTLHALESSNFIGIGRRLLRSSDLDLLTTLG